MRIVGGRFKGRQLKTPSNADIRPTSDRTREALFNILAHGEGAVDLEGAAVLDLYCGSGALSLEAVSRGAASAVMVDQAASSLRLAKDNILACGAGEQVQTLKLNAAQLPPPAFGLKKKEWLPADLVFLDPPYGKELILPTLLGIKSRGWAKAGAMIVVEAGVDEEYRWPPGFKLIQDRVYGAARVHFLNKSS